MPLAVSVYGSRTGLAARCSRTGQDPPPRPHGCAATWTGPSPAPAARLTAAASVGAPTGDARSLLARLELAARSVDGELRVIEAHPDSARVRPALAGPRERAALVRSAAAELVDGLLAAAGHDADDLALLHTACVIEAEALRASGRRARSSV